MTWAQEEKQRVEDWKKQSEEMTQKREEERRRCEDITGDHDAFMDSLIAWRK